jgi:hypothetical protein
VRVPAPMRHGRSPPQSPMPGFDEKYCSLSGFPSHSLESAGGAFLTVMFGHILAYFVMEEVLADGKCHNGCVSREPDDIRDDDKAGTRGLFPNGLPASG